MGSQRVFIFPVTVQFEDIDVCGVVHHPNYLKYLERARSHSLKEYGYSLERFLSSDSALALSEFHAKYLRPAFIEQQLFVITQISFIGKSSIKVNQSIVSSLPKIEEIEINEQKIFSLAEILFWAQVELICVDLKSAKLKSIPQELRQAIRINLKSMAINNVNNLT